MIKWNESEIRPILLYEIPFVLFQLDKNVYIFRTVSPILMRFSVKQSALIVFTNYKNLQKNYHNDDGLMALIPSDVNFACKRLVSQFRRVGKSDLGHTSL